MWWVRAGFLLSCVFSHHHIHCFSWNMFHLSNFLCSLCFQAPIFTNPVLFFQEESDCCTACCFWKLVHSYLFIMSDSLCLSYPMVALNLMEAVLCSPIKVLKFCSKLDYGCGAWNVWSRLVGSGSAYFYFERLSFPRHLSWNGRSSVFP